MHVISSLLPVANCLTEATLLAKHTPSGVETLDGQTQREYPVGQDRLSSSASEFTPPTARPSSQLVSEHPAHPKQYDPNPDSLS